jgi:preprotein translocase subunit Sec61beta
VNPAVKRCLAPAALAFVFAACTVGSGAPTTLSEVRVPTLRSGASFDSVEIDQKGRRLFAADRTDSGVDVFDLTSNPPVYTHTISFSSAPNGLAYAPDLKRLFVGLADGSVGVVDEHEVVIKTIPAGGKYTDLIDYSPSTQEVYAANPGDSIIARIDAVTGAVKNTITIQGFGLEQPRYNPTDHMLYVTSPDAGYLYALDPNQGTIKSKTDLGSCTAHGLAINPATGQALIACSTWVERINLRDANDRETFSEVSGGDVVTYDAAADRFLVATSADVPSGVAVLGGNPIKYIATVPTRSKGNSAVLDEGSQVVYTPDTRAGTAGLVAFTLPSAEPPLTIDPTSLVELGVIVAVIIAAMFVVGRGGDPVNRPEPIAPRRRRA